MTKEMTIQEIVDNRLKVPNGFFKWAMNDFPIYEWTNKSRTIISSDRKKFSKKVTKRLSLNSRLTFVGDTFYYVWMGVTKKRIEMQMYSVTQSFEKGKEKFKVRLYNFYQLANNKMVKAHRDPFLSAQKGKEVDSKIRGMLSFLVLVHLVSIRFMGIWKVLFRNYKQSLS